MEKRKSTMTSAPAARLGRDELNLCQFPIVLLSDRGGQRERMLRYEDGERIWEVSGAEAWGLPAGRDLAVYVCLLELAREQQFPDRVVFRRAPLLERLGWGQDGRAYERLALSFKRWKGVEFAAHHCFVDGKQRKRKDLHGFGLVNEYLLVSVESGEEPLSWVELSRSVLESVRSGYVKRLDVGLFLSLSSTLAQQLYRFLDARSMDGKRAYRQELRSLACEHLGLSRFHNAAQLKRQLDRVHEELLSVGYLAGVAYQSGKAGEVVVYRFAGLQAPGSRCQARQDGEHNGEPDGQPSSLEPGAWSLEPALQGLWQEMSADDRAVVARLRRERARREGKG